MEERELPMGWVDAPLLALGELIRGVTYSKNDASDSPFPGSIPVMRANNIQDRSFDMANLFHVPSALVSYGQVVKAGDVVIATSSGSISVVGKAAQARENLDMAFGAFCGLIRPSREISSEYFGHFFSSDYYRQAVSDLARGVNINNLKKSHFESLSIALAPLNEQRRIAAKLDTTLAAVDACRQRLDGVADLLKRFRQAVLAAATSGELTREWREDRGIERDWPEVQLGDHAEGFNYGTSAKSQSEGEIPVLRMGNIQAGELDWSDLVYTSDLAEIAKYMLDPGDVLFNRTNSPELVGKTAIYRGEQPAIYAGYLIRVRCSASLEPEFLNLSLNSPRARDYCWRVKSDGVSQSNINAKKLVAYLLELPPIEEQQEIIRRAKGLFDLADQLEARLNAARKIVDRLTPALLAKAFRGELVPQDPGDEPASVLLARIRAPRQAEAGAGKPSRHGRPKAAATPAQLHLDAAPVPSDSLPPDVLACLLRECGPLSERALLAASELRPETFRVQLARE
ncbi:MAG: restriction endonuclease subunit S, partial [Cyanobium sp.]